MVVISLMNGGPGETETYLCWESWGRGSRRLVTQYTRGRAAEYRAMQLLKREEWIVGRSAGSHSPVDLFAAKKGKVLLVQVKNGSARVKKVEMTELVKWAVHFDADAEVWFFRGRRELERKRVHTSTDRSR